MRTGAVLKKIEMSANNLFTGVGATFLLVVCLTKYFDLYLWVTQTSGSSRVDQQPHVTK